MNKCNEYKYVDEQGRLAQWPSKQKDKILVLAYLASKFSYGRAYTESMVNELLKVWHTFSDWPLLRRELVVAGFLDRNADGSNYHLRELATSLPDLSLVRPNLAKDAHQAVEWLQGPAGRDTLRLMGNTEAQNKPSTLSEEHNRLRDFITSTTEDTWMLRYQGKTIGAIWLSFEASDYLQAPSIRIMIGDPTVRGRGIGGAAVTALIEQLAQAGKTEYLYSRYLIGNTGSATLLARLGFTHDGNTYHDRDGLEFQNVRLALTRRSPVVA
jgi:GNAT superfamily N-acetyltransferase